MTPVMLVIGSLLAAASAPHGGVWGTITGAVEDNPTLTLFALIVGAFSAGFAVRKLFEDRETGRLRSRVSELEASNTTTAERQAQYDARNKQNEQLAARLTELLTPDYLLTTLAEHLKPWPSDKHPLVVAAVMRQLLLIPGAAWLCTPTNSVLIKADFDPVTGTAKNTMVIDHQTDPIKDLRQLVTNTDTLTSALLDLAIHGSTSVLIATTPDERVGLRVRQGPSLHWSIVRSTYQREKSAKHP